MSRDEHDHEEGLSVPVGGLAAAARVQQARVARRSQIREVVFGAQDGLLSTLALVTGVRGAQTDRATILVAGFAGALAGTISMALGAYIATKSQRDLFTNELAIERGNLERRPFVERMELADILQSEGLSQEAARRAADALGENEEVLLKTMAEKELGIPYDPSGSPLEDALIMGTSFVIGASIPIAPYLVVDPGRGLWLSVVLTLAALFGLGVAKARLTAGVWWRSGLEIALLAGAGALLSYLVGQLLPQAAGVDPPLG